MSWFACDDQLISPARVDDDYCDCLDGSDEPTTGACPDTLFVCGRVALFASRVNDGICDCCTGADENLSGVVCPYNCLGESTLVRVLAASAAAACCAALVPLLLATAGILGLEWPDEVAEVELHKESASTRVGITLSCYDAEGFPLMGEAPRVSSVAETGLSAACPAISDQQRLIAINGDVVQGAAHGTQLLKAAEGRVLLCLQPRIHSGRVPRTTVWWLAVLVATACHLLLLWLCFASQRPASRGALGNSLSQRSHLLVALAPLATSLLAERAARDAQHGAYCCCLASAVLIAAVVSIMVAEPHTRQPTSAWAVLAACGLCGLQLSAARVFAQRAAWYAAPLAGHAKGKAD